MILLVLDNYKINMFISYPHRGFFILTDTREMGEVLIDCRFYPPSFDLFFISMQGEKKMHGCKFLNYTP